MQEPMWTQAALDRAKQRWIATHRSNQLSLERGTTERIFQAMFAVERCGLALAGMHALSEHTSRQAWSGHKYPGYRCSSPELALSQQPVIPTNLCQLASSWQQAAAHSAVLTHARCSDLSYISMQRCPGPYQA